MLTQHTPDLWTLAHALSVGPLPMGTRTTIVRLPDGRLVVHAPGALTDEDVAAVRALGPVAAVVAPNPMHHMFLAAALGAFPEAEGWGAPGVEKKHPELKLSAYDGRPGPWSGALETHAVAGATRLGETVLFDPRSRTLVLTDLCFNIRSVEGWFAKMNLQMLDAYGRFGPSFLCRNWFITDARAARGSIDHLLAWAPDRIVVAHGDVVEGGGQEALRAAFTWMK
jgi:hypothetical protein